MALLVIGLAWLYVLELRRKLNVGLAHGRLLAQPVVAVQAAP
jgi:hypothetical protein